MTEADRLRLGGWAAIGFAVAILVKFVLSLIALGSLDGSGSLTLVTIVELVQFVLLGAAVVGLYRWFAAVDLRLANVATALGLGAAGVGIFLDVDELIGGRLSEDVLIVAGLASQLLLGGWFLVEGTLVGRSGTLLASGGWLGQIGGVGYLILAASYGVALVAPTAQGLGGVAVFAPFLALFGIAFLVRLGRFAATGRVVVGPI